MRKESNLGGVVWLVIMAAIVYGAWHMVNRHEWSWWGALSMPPVPIYYAAESVWHSDGRREVCGKAAKCGGTFAKSGGAPIDYDQCMHKLEVKLAAESDAKQRQFERFAKSFEKMTCEEIAESAAASGETEVRRANR
jgi:hypothetical protein